MFIKITSKEEVPGFIFENHNCTGDETKTRQVTLVRECKDIQYYLLYKGPGQSVAFNAETSREVSFIGDTKDNYVGDVLLMQITNLDGSYEDIIGYGINLYIMNEHGKTVDSKQCFISGSPQNCHLPIEPQVR